MVKLVAYQSVDTRDLSELGLFQNIKKNLDRKGEGKAFDATSGNIKMHVDGSNMVFVLKNPVSGKMKKVQVEVGGADDYTVSGLSIKLTSMKKYFKGNYEAKIFSGNDNLNGSNQADTLSAFNGADTVNGNNGADTLLGGSGNDKLLGGNGGDSITGGKDNDLLDGGQGFDTLTGNSGNDTFRFSTQISSNNSSKITDFAIGRDTIQLDHNAFANIGSKGKLAASQFFLSTDYAGEAGAVIYTKASGVLSYAVSSGPIANAIKFGEVSSDLNLTNKDFFII